MDNTRQPFISLLFCVYQIMFLEFWNSSPFQGFQNDLNRIFSRAGFILHRGLSIAGGGDEQERINSLCPIPGRIELPDKFRAV